MHYPWPCPKSRLNFDRFFLSGLWKSGRRLFGQGHYPYIQSQSALSASRALRVASFGGRSYYFLLLCHTSSERRASSAPVCAPSIITTSLSRNSIDTRPSFVL